MGGVVDELYSTDLEIAGEPGVEELYEPASADQPGYLCSDVVGSREDTRQPSSERLAAVLLESGVVAGPTVENDPPTI